MNIIENPPENWISCLREGNQVWLCKEQQVAEVVSPYVPAGHLGSGICGKLFLAFQNGRIFYWFIRNNGNGIDQIPLIRPIEGQLPDTPIQMSSQEAQVLTTRLNILENKVANLTNVINGFMDPYDEVFR